MRVSERIPWERYGLIVELARRLEAVSPQFGKTALQKLVYILDASFGVRLDYEFTLYTYGPYSQELASDLEIVASIGGVELMARANGVHIRTGKCVESIVQRSESFTSEYVEVLDELVRTFGSFSATDLELRATLIFVSQHELLFTREELMGELTAIKPHFEAPEVFSAIDELTRSGHISVA